jgi:hypothetical protein
MNAKSGDICVAHTSYKFIYDLFLFSLRLCGAGISPKSLNYASKSIENNVLLEYKYDDLLDKKYKKKETQNEVRLISVKITNNKEKDLVFGKDLQLV